MSVSTQISNILFGGIINLTVWVFYKIYTIVEVRQNPTFVVMD
jgi:hypothetical protein